MELGGSTGPVRAAYKAVVCDLDGVVYRGDSAVPGAPETLREWAAQGTRIVFATNNASRLPADVADHLTGIGMPATADDVVTSAQAGADHLRSMLPAGARVLALGGEGVAAALTQAGFTAVSPGAQDAGDQVDGILQGLGRQLTVLDFENAARHLAAGAVWVASNEDSTFPLEWGLAPGNGAYVSLLAGASGRTPIVVGKPHPPLYEAAVRRLGTDARETVAIGDRLDTDIAGGAAAGLDTAWVLTGVHRPTDLLRHAEVSAPTWVVSRLDELDEPYAAVLAADGKWASGGGWVRMHTDGLEIVAGDAKPVELVRAGLAAVLDARDRGVLDGLDLGRAGAQLDALLENQTGD
jgi:HAD superfamily hydrolase (TIGR01450 family)